MRAPFFCFTGFFVTVLIKNIHQIFIFPFWQKSMPNHGEPQKNAKQWHEPLSLPHRIPSLFCHLQCDRHHHRHHHHRSGPTLASEVGPRRRLRTRPSSAACHAPQYLHLTSPPFLGDNLTAPPSPRLPKQGNNN